MCLVKEANTIFKILYGILILYCAFYPKCLLICKSLRILPQYLHCQFWLVWSSYLTTVPFFIVLLFPLLQFADHLHFYHSEIISIVQSIDVSASSFKSMLIQVEYLKGKYTDLPQSFANLEPLSFAMIHLDYGFLFYNIAFAQPVLGSHFPKDISQLHTVKIVMSFL